MIILVVIVNSVEGRPPKLYGLFDNMGSSQAFSGMMVVNNPLIWLLVSNIFHESSPTWGRFPI